MTNTRTITITDYQLLDAGVQNSKKFQGHYVDSARWQSIATGHGETFGAAIDDALATIGDHEPQVDTDALGQLIIAEQGYTADDLASKVDSSLDSEDSEFYYYVSIRYNIPEWIGPKVVR